MVTSNPILIARIADENDFLRLKEMASCHDDWGLAYDKKELKVWSRNVADSAVKMIKVWALFSGFSSQDLYNAIMDPGYRRDWDPHLIMLYSIGFLNPNNEISYYAVSFPPPLRSRDFVLQTSWLDKRTEHYILNHSVCHKDHPPRAGFIRALSYFTGYFIKAASHEGCEMFFVSQTDLQGFIPNWVAAKCMQIFAPRIVKQIEQAALGYSAWKSQNGPDYFPWLKPEQLKVSIISTADCVPSDEEKSSTFYKNVSDKMSKQAPSMAEHQYTYHTSPTDNLNPSSPPGPSSVAGKGSEQKERRKGGMKIRSLRSNYGKKEKHKKCKATL